MDAQSDRLAELQKDVIDGAVKRQLEKPPRPPIRPTGHEELTSEPPEARSIRLAEPPLGEHLRRVAGRLRMEAQCLEGLAEWLGSQNVPSSVELAVRMLAERLRG